ncbi:SDR family NAD(P)-dependent oxidoreductase [Paraferrimonas sedimenticola]|uniref:Short-chain dehydrogenase n=1 Tax=Paraferrimonas sedimenticola TaxID=375674 RepID=A0AA37RRN6_9GAMM|nr:SDR family oxidoreductase [Paraferrimonas sedimenticola]GLP94714.1 short-chain dehydrogenase [Paraferrimonas sedimenticola]
MAKTLVITGSTSGLGLATAHSAVAKGANLVVSSESETALQETLAEFSSHANVVGMVCDVTDASQIQALIQTAHQTFGKIDCWINNAGTTTPSGPTTEVPLAMANLLVSVNIQGCLQGSSLACRYFRKQGYGRLINITGRGEKGPQVDANCYSASKAWARNFTLALRKEEAGNGIEVGTFNPGLILTALTQHPRVLKGKHEKFIKGLKTVLPIIGNPASVSGEALAGFALQEKPLKAENRAGSFVWTALGRLISGRRADVNVETISPKLIEPELD